MVGKKCFINTHAYTQASDSLMIELILNVHHF